MNEDEDFLSNYEHVDEDLILEAKKRQKDAEEAAKKAEKEAEETKKKIIPPDVIEFRQIAIPLLNKFAIQNKKDVGFVNETFRVNDTETLAYLNYFEERFKITHSHLEHEKIEVLNKLKNIEKPDSFDVSKFLTIKNFIVLSLVLTLAFIIHQIFGATEILISIGCIAVIYFCTLQLFNHYKAIQKFNHDKQLATVAYTEFLNTSQKTKEKEFLNMYETKYMPSLPFDKKVLVKKLDMDFEHLKNKTINIPRLIYESLKNENKYWNQFIIDRLLKVFHYNDNIRIEEYLLGKLSNDVNSKFSNVQNFMNNMENKRERFYNALQNMTDEEFKRFLNSEQT